MSFDSISLCLENALFGSISMPYEWLRVALAFIGLTITSYYDIFNRRNIPDNLVYGFFAISALLNIAFFDMCTVVYALAILIPISIFGYAMYRMGQWGGADALVLVSLALLLPAHPSFLNMQLNYPFVFSIFVFSATLFAIYVVLSLLPKLLSSKAKPDLKYLILLVPYVLVLYMLTNAIAVISISPIYLFVLMVALFSSLFYLLYKESITNMLAEEVHLSKAEEGDIAVLELMGQETVDKYRLQRLLTFSELQRLKSLKLKSIWIYTALPPFLPFLLAGMVFALLFSPLLLS